MAEKFAGSWFNITQQSEPITTFRWHEFQWMWIWTYTPKGNICFIITGRLQINEAEIKNH